MKKITVIEPTTVRNRPTKLRVAAYCRVSTGIQHQLISLKTQKAHYEQFISSNPEWTFVGLYYDEGISGTHMEKRPALLRMISDCENHKIDKVVTKSLSRFARNVTDCLELVRKLSDLGVPIFFEKENLDTGEMESELLLSVMSSLAESESISISENYKWGARHQYQNGTFKPRCAPYGYTVNHGEYQVNPAEAPWVRYIFSEAAAGTSCYRIAVDLNEKGIPAKKGGTWTGTTIRGILRNERYIGDCLYQKTYSDFRFKRHMNHGEQDQFYVTDHHEPIVNRELFEAAGQMLRQHAKEKSLSTGAGKYHNKYSFSGMIVCGECGAKFKRQIHRSGSVQYTIWVCREHLRNKKKCTMKAVRETALENAFATMMNKLIYAREPVLGELLRSFRGQGNEESYQQLNEINEAFDGMTDRREALSTILAKGYIDPAAYTQEMNRLFAEAEELENEKKRVLKEISGDQERTEMVRELLKWTERTEMLTAFDAELFQRFVGKIMIISREEAEFHLKCGLRLKERI